MFACICHAVPENVVADAARAGASTAEIAQATRAGTSCGRCWEVLSTIVLRTKRCDRTGAPCTGCRDDEGEAADADPPWDATGARSGGMGAGSSTVGPAPEETR